MSITDERIRELAKSQYHREGECEVDDNAQVSLCEGGDPGAYVQAWVYVDLAEEEEVTP